MIIGVKNEATGEVTDQNKIRFVIAYNNITLIDEPKKEPLKNESKKANKTESTNKTEEGSESTSAIK